eukprot:4821185-Heterocapsa_arctica.AAC.1
MPALIPAPADYMEPVKIEGPFASLSTSSSAPSPAAVLTHPATPRAKPRPPLAPPPRPPRSSRRGA